MRQGKDKDKVVVKWALCGGKVTIRNLPWQRVSVWKLRAHLWPQVY